MQKYFTTNGRLSRLEFWMFYGVMLVVFTALGGVIKVVGEESTIGSVLVVAFMLPLMIISIIVQIKRWHDRNKTGWWVLISLVPIIGVIWNFIELGCLKGSEGANDYGSDPAV